jgi:hypothetical protein
MTRYLLLFDSYSLVFVGLPLWREAKSVFCICSWNLPAQSFSDPSPLGLATIFYCLRFETSLFIASYDSQGHSEGIRPRLHTGPGKQKFHNVVLSWIKLSCLFWFRAYSDLVIQINLAAAKIPWMRNWLILKPVSTQVSTGKRWYAQNRSRTYGRSVNTMKDTGLKCSHRPQDRCDYKMWFTINCIYFFPASVYIVGNRF